MVDCILNTHTSEKSWSAKYKFSFRSRLLKIDLVIVLQLNQCDQESVECWSILNLCSLFFYNVACQDEKLGATFYAFIVFKNKSQLQMKWILRLIEPCDMQLHSRISSSWQNKLLPGNLISLERPVGWVADSISRQNCISWTG